MTTPRKFEPEHTVRIERLSALGHSNKEIAEDLGVTPRTLRRWKDDPRVRGALARGRAERDSPPPPPLADREALEPEDYAGAFRAAAEGFSDRTISRRLGLPFVRFQELLEGDDTLAQSIADGRGANADKWITYLENAARAGTASAAIAGLEMFHGFSRERPAPPDRPNVRITFNLPGAVAPEDWPRVIEATAERPALSESTATEASP